MQKGLSLMINPLPNGEELVALITTKNYTTTPNVL
jgi:hypothetical protein